MGKQGPCYHCGVTSTPLWRNGPPEKPVLCNACGSRWRTKGTLANYTPLHARSDADDYEDQRVSKLKAIFLRKKDEKIKKRKLYYENNVGSRFAPGDCHGFQKSIDEDTSYRSSSGSMISNFESSAHIGSGDTSDLTGPAQSITWETQVPSRKRTCVSRPKQSSVEKLTKDLCTILHEQQSSYLSGSSEEDLLFETGTPLVSVEIGHGSVLMKHPSSLAREEESEASSLSVETKQCAINEAYSHSTPLSEHNDYNGEHIHYHVSEKPKKLAGQMIRQELVRDKFNNARMQQLWRRDSPLHSIDLNDVVNFDVLVGHLTREEQQQLLKYLPSSDTYTNPDSLMGMFESSGFKDDLSSFQHLVSEGILSNAFSGVNAEDFKTLKKLVLSNLTKSKWLELYKKLKDDIPSCTNGEHGSIAISGCKSSLVETKRKPKKPCDIECSEMSASEVKPAIRSPLGKTVIENGHQETKDSSEIDLGSFFNPKSLLMPTNGGRLLMLDSYQFADESSDQDILLDVPSNGSFPEAEFLLPTSS